MAATLREALRERVTVRTALTWLAVTGVLWLAFDSSPAQFAVTMVSTAVIGLSDVAADAYDLKGSVAHVGLGLYTLLSGLAMLLLEEGGVPWHPGVFLAVGAWYVLDAVQTVRHEGATEDEPTGREVYHDYVGRRIDEALDDGPRTRRELSEELEADDAAVDAALETLESRGVVVREGSAIRSTEPDDGGIAGKVGRLARRVARPLTLELGRADEAANAESNRSRTPDSNRARAGTDGPDRSAGSTRSGVFGEREREEGREPEPGREEERERVPEREPID
ncbi:MAG: MFS transporter [Halosimplex sp.]